jgi:hypothetical protein
MSPLPRSGQEEGWILSVPGLIRNDKARHDSGTTAASNPSVLRSHQTAWQKL